MIWIFWRHISSRLIFQMRLQQFINLHYSYIHFAGFVQTLKKPLFIENYTVTSPPFNGFHGVYTDVYRLDGIGFVFFFLLKDFFSEEMVHFTECLIRNGSKDLEMWDAPKEKKKHSQQNISHFIFHPNDHFMIAIR